MQSFMENVVSHPAGIFGLLVGIPGILCMLFFFVEWLISKPKPEVKRKRKKGDPFPPTRMTM